MHIVSSVSTVVRACKDASVQVDQRGFFFFFLGGGGLPRNKTIGSDAKSITHCEIFASKFKRRYDKQSINQTSNVLRLRTLV